MASGADNITAAQKERLEKAVFFAQQNPKKFVEALMDVLTTATTAAKGG